MATKKTPKKVNPEPGDRLGGKNSKAVVLTDAQREEIYKNGQFWMLRSTHGRQPIFQNPELLRDACLQYCYAVEKYPLLESRIFCYKGMVTKTSATKMRAMTLEGLYIFIGLSERAWLQYRKREGYGEICTEIEMIFYNQKLTGAAADLLNGRVISRHLGLKDSLDHSSTDGTMSTQPLTDHQKQMLEKLQDDEY